MTDTKISIILRNPDPHEPKSIAGIVQNSISQLLSWSKSSTLPLKKKTLPATTTLNATPKLICTKLPQQKIVSLVPIHSKCSKELETAKSAKPSISLQFDNNEESPIHCPSRHNKNASNATNPIPVKPSCQRRNDHQLRHPKASNTSKKKIHGPYVTDTNDSKSELIDDVNKKIVAGINLTSKIPGKCIQSFSNLANVDFNHGTGRKRTAEQKQIEVSVNDIQVKSEDENDNMSQRSGSGNAKIRFSTSIFETDGSQCSQSDTDSEDFDIQMDPVDDEKESDTSENEDNMEYSLSLQRYLESTESVEPLSLTSIHGRSVHETNERSDIVEAQKRTRSSFNVLTEITNILDLDTTDNNDEESQSSSYDEESDDGSSIFSFEDKKFQESMLGSKTPSIKSELSDSSIESIKSEIKNEHPEEDNHPNNSALIAPMASTDSSSFDENKLFNESTELAVPFPKHRDSERNSCGDDECELICLSGYEPKSNQNKNSKIEMPSCIPKYRLLPIKPEPEDEDVPINKRTGAVKIRHHPRRQRNYDYRKRSWRCPCCSDTMKYGSRFKHLQLKHKHPYLCPKCPFKSKMRYRLKKHMLKHNDGKKFKCKHCTASFCFMETLDRHQKSTHLKGMFALKCIICDAEFGSTIELGKHHRSEHPGDKPYECQQCDKAYASSGALKLHILGQHQAIKPYVCDTCGFGFTRRDKMELHKNRHFQRDNKVRSGAIDCNLKCPHVKPRLNGEAELHICDTCGHVCEFCSYIFKSNRLFNAHTHINFCAVCVLKFSNERSYKLHVAYHEPESIICHRCELCKFGFTDIRFLNIHAVKVHQLKLLDYKCQTCTKIFKAPHLLAAHVRQVHKVFNKNHKKCYFCKETFLTITRLHFHLHRTHTMERHYQCKKVKSCRKEFVRQTDLNRHLKSHNGDKLFQCNICDLKLKSNRNLQLHFKIHQENKKTYLCDICGVGVAQKCYLKIHMQLHDKDGKPYKCCYCEKAYLKPEGLESHVKEKHELVKNYYSCSKCKKKFSTRQGLKEHTRNLKCGVRMGQAKGSTSVK